MAREGGERRRHGAVARVGFAIRQARLRARAAAAGFAIAKGGSSTLAVVDRSRHAIKLHAQAARVHNSFARLRRLRQKFLRSPLAMYRFVMDVSTADNEGAVDKVSSDSLQMRRYFQRRVPLANCALLLNLFAILQSIHVAFEANDMDLVLGRLAAFYQFIEGVAVLGLGSDVAWAHTHLPVPSPVDYRAPTDGVPRLTPSTTLGVAMRHSANLSALVALDGDATDPDVRGPEE